MVTWRPGLGSTSYGSTVSALTPSYCPSCPPSLPLAVMAAESSGNPSAVSSAGAIGLFQLMPATAASLGVDPTDPTQNIVGGLTYLQSLYNQFGNWTQALEAYNQGPTSLQNALNAGTTPVSAGYASSILAAAGISDDSDGSGSENASITGSTSPSSDLSDTLDLTSLTGLSTVTLVGIAAGLFALVLWIKR